VAEQTGVDIVVNEMIAVLDSVAARAELAHRSALRQIDHAFHPAPVLDQLQQFEAQYRRDLAATLSAREQQAIGILKAGPRDDPDQADRVQPARDRGLRTY
jgi:hypothetical protein